jgi:hypothetical protein
MGTYGGFAPGAERYGGGNRRLQRIVESLNAQRGDAYDTTGTSTVYADNMAVARSIDGAWSTNTRLANIADPERTTELARWERILAIVPGANDSDQTRRARIRERRARTGRMPTSQSIADDVRRACGDVFVTIHHLTTANARVFWPGGTQDPDSPWYSTVAYVAVELRIPAAMSTGEFLDRTAPLAEIMDGRLPAWVTWGWFIEPSTGTGFILDDEHNLDAEAFDE